MPFMKTKICRKCGIEQSIDSFRFRTEAKRPKGYYVSTCKACEKIRYQQYQKSHLEYFREANKKAYLQKVGTLTRNRYHTKESRAAKYRNKALLRATRAKQARVTWDKEFTAFVYAEAHSLRKLRNQLTGFEWHVDHVIPLKGKVVCGLHVWNNFAVIPKVTNLRKGNYYSVHD